MGTQIIGPDPNCLPVGSDRIGHLTLANESIAEIGVSLRAIAVDFKSLSEINNSFIQLSLFQQSIAKTIVGNIIVRRVGESVIPQGFTIPPGRGLDIAVRRQSRYY